MSEIELEFKTLSGFQADHQSLLLGVLHAGSDGVGSWRNHDVDININIDIGIDVFVRWRQIILPTQRPQFQTYTLLESQQKFTNPLPGGEVK